MLKVNVAVTAVQQTPTGRSVVFQAVYSTQSILLAAGFVGLGVLVVSRLRGSPGRLQPGHWILVAEVSIIAWTLPVSLAFFFIQAAQELKSPVSHTPWLSIANLGLFCLAMLVRGALYFLAVYRTRDGLLDGHFHCSGPHGPSPRAGIRIVCSRPLAPAGPAVRLL